MTDIKTASILSESGYSKLLHDLRKIWESGKAKAKRVVTRQLLQTYWEIGGRIVEEKLTSNAGYEKAVMERLADDMRTDMTTLYRCVQFHETYQSIPESESLSWSHYRVLLTVKDLKERDFYTHEAEKKHWTRDQLLKAVQGDGFDEDKKGTKAKKLSRPIGATYVFKAIVLEVVDGDTIVVDVDCGFEIKKKERIRLAGVAWQRRQRCRAGRSVACTAAQWGGACGGHRKAQIVCDLWERHLFR